MTMPPNSGSSRRERPGHDRPHVSPALLVVAFCLVAAVMRPAITAVGPVLDQISASTGMSAAVLGLITSVPLVCWAAVSPFAHDLSRRFGLSRMVTASLVVLGVGVIARSWPGGSGFLWVGTLLIGVAIAIGNVLMPAAVKRDFPSRVPLMMGVYSGLLGATGAVASGIAVPLSDLRLAPFPAGWPTALAITGAAVVPLAIVAWAWSTRGQSPSTRSADAPRGRTGIWRDRVAWLVAGYMGLQATSFYILVTWIPALSTSTGRDATLAGVDVMVYQLTSLVGALGLPFLLRGRTERWAPGALPLIGMIGIVGLLVAPGAISVWIAVLGVFSGASLTMSLTLMAVRARDHHAASALSGMSQSVGYLITAVGPVAFGALHAATDGWVLPLALMLAYMVGQAVVGLFAGRDRFVLDGR